MTADAVLAGHIGQVEVGRHASSDYLGRQGVPASTDELARHAIIGFDQITPFLRHAMTALPTFDSDEFAISTDSNLA